MIYTIGRFHQSFVVFWENLNFKGANQLCLFRCHEISMKLVRKWRFIGKSWRKSSLRKDFNLLWSQVEMTTTAKSLFFSLPPGDPFALFAFDSKSPTFLGLKIKLNFKFDFNFDPFILFCIKFLLWLTISHCLYRFLEGKKKPLLI